MQTCIDRVVSHGMIGCDTNLTEKEHTDNSIFIDDREDRFCQSKVTSVSDRLLFRECAFEKVPVVASAVLRKERAPGRAEFAEIVDRIPAGDHGRPVRVMNADMHARYCGQMVCECVNVLCQSVVLFFCFLHTGYPLLPFFVYFRDCLHISYAYHTINIGKCQDGRNVHFIASFRY